ncbi:MAG: tetratricopeptide repeat protein [Acidobacteriota bacterium]
MAIKRISTIILFSAFAALNAPGQAPAAYPGPSPMPKLSAVLEAKLGPAEKLADATRENRELAYVKLLEGQRYIWTITNSRRGRSQASMTANAALAREALVAAITLDPKLDEAYTALAEIYLSAPPADVDEALALAGIAVKLEPNSFGSRRIIARLMTYKSGLSSGTLDKAIAAKAVAAWSEIVRLDPRNAEAWAFLSEFYERLGKSDDQIAALRSWLGSAPPIDDQFYQRTMGGRETLAPQSASLKLGPALLKAGKIGQAIEVLSQVSADDPQNEISIDLLRGAVESLRGDDALAAVRSLEQVATANPGNLALTELLAQAKSRAGDVDAAVKLLAEAVDRVRVSDVSGASGLYLSQGDIYAGADRTREAVTSYEKALSVRGLDTAVSVGDDEREFAMQVFEKMVQTLKSANRGSDVRATIERSRRLFGKDDLFADRHLIAYYRETGKKQEALDAVRKVRMRLPNDYGFMRLEATLLTELGRVDEGVGIIKRSMAEKPAAGTAVGTIGNIVSAVPSGDEFSNFLFISNLYSQANRGREASDAANQAYTVAKGAERKQIARLTLATAQQNSGDFKGAEQTLRAILSESPGNPIAMNNLGYFLLERNERAEEALGLIEQAYRIDPTNPSYLDSLGWANFRLGKLDDAERYLKDAARYDSGSSTIQEHLGDVYEKQGKLDLAKIAWNKALQLASDPADTVRLKQKLTAK